MNIIRCGQEESCQQCIKEMVHIIRNQNFPIMEFIDEVVDFLQVLLAKKEYEIYRELSPIIMDLAARTEVRNMQRRLLTLEIQYCQEIGDEMNYEKKAA